MFARKKYTKLSTNFKKIYKYSKKVFLINKKNFKEVFYTRKVRPRDLTENFGTGSVILLITKLIMYRCNKKYNY